MIMMMMTSLSMMLIGACDPNCVLLTSHTWQPKSRSLEILNAEEKTENIQSLTDLCHPIWKYSEFNKYVPEHFKMFANPVWNIWKYPEWKIALWTFWRYSESQNSLPD